jgi:cytochrome c oxidase subunit 3
MFFFAFFFAFFHEVIFPVDQLDGVWSVGNGVWPPVHIKTLDPWSLPFMNTLILLLSGTTVTWAHYAMLENNRSDMIRGLGYTIGLGLFFSCVQAYEYIHASFKFTEGVYPSIFYMATGFHGLHVFIGTIFLAVCWIRAKNGHFDKGNGHLGFEFAAWYWHFVDVVWLFLFVFVYIWGK